MRYLLLLSLVLSRLCSAEASAALVLEGRICQEHLRTVATKAQAEEVLKAGNSPEAEEGIRRMVRYQEEELKKLQQKYRKKTGRPFNLAKCQTDDNLKNLKAQIGKEKSGKKDKREASIDEVSGILDPPTLLQALCNLAALPADAPVSDGKNAAQMKQEFTAAFRKKTGKAPDLSRCKR